MEKCPFDDFLVALIQFKFLDTAIDRLICRDDRVSFFGAGGKKVHDVSFNSELRIVL